MVNNETVLVLAPHTDDGELGCGATISKFIEEGKNIYYAAFSICEESVPEGYPENILETEVKKATHVLGIKQENLIVYKFKVRRFPEFRQEILEELVKLKKQINPDLVLCLLHTMCTRIIKRSSRRVAGLSKIHLSWVMNSCGTTFPFILPAP